MQVQSHDVLYPQDHPPSSQPRAGDASLALAPVASGNPPLQDGSTVTHLYTRGNQLVAPSRYQPFTRSSFEGQIQRALGGQVSIDDQALARAVGVAGTAFACAEKRSNILSTLPLYVGDPGENPLVEQDTPFRFFVSQQAAQIFYMVGWSLLTWGRFYLRKRYNTRGYPTGLEFVYPQDVIFEDVDLNTGDVRHYDILDPITFKITRVPASEIIYDQMFDPKSGEKGLSRLEVAWRELHIQLGMSTFAASYFTNSAQPDGIITFDEAIEVDKVRQVEEFWRANFKGARNAHRNAVLPLGMKWEAMTPAPKDLAMGELDDKTSRKIHVIFDVHPALTGSESTSDPLSANSTYSAILVDHIRSVAIPLLTRVILPALNTQWAHRDFDRSNYYTLYVDEIRIPALAEANLVKVQSAAQAKNDGLLDYNEAREVIGYEPREQGEYFIRSPKEALEAFAGGAISLNTLQWYIRGEKTTDPNGDVRLINGLLLPTARLLEVANANVDRMLQPPVMFGGPQLNTNGGGPAQSITVTKPTPPELPPSMDPQPEERGGGESLCIALGLPNQPDLVGFQQQMRTHFAGQPADWNDPADLHTTLLFAPNVTNEQMRQIMQVLRVLQLPTDMQLGIGSARSFDAFGSHALHLRIKRNADLLDLQETIYELVAGAGIGVSSHHTPTAFIPHITMGYFQQKPSTVYFAPNVKVTPTALWVYRGDKIIYERSLQAPALPQPEIDPARSYIGAPAVGTPGATALLTLADASALMAHQDALRYMVAESMGGTATGVRWTGADAMHITLVSASVADDDQLLTIIRAVEPYISAGMSLKAGPLSAFEQGAYNVLILPVQPDEQLSATQAMLFDRFAALGIPMSEFSAPGKYQAHITMAYLPKDVPVPTSDAVFDITPNGVIFSRESYETIYSLPFAVEDKGAPLSPTGEMLLEDDVVVRAAPPPDALEVVAAFPDAQVVRYARRELARWLTLFDYENPEWIGDSDWALLLARIDDFNPREAAKLIRQADYSDARKIDLWTTGYTLADGVIYLLVEDSDAFEALKTSAAIDAAAVGRTTTVPPINGIPLCTVQQDIDLTGAPEAHYPLVVNNVTVRKGQVVQHQWMLRHAPKLSADELEKWQRALRNRGREYAFQRHYLRETSAETFVLAALAAEVDEEEVFDLARALLRGDWTLRTYADTREGFIDAITDLFTDGQANDITRKKFGAQLRMYLRGYGLQAFRDGMKSAGYDPESYSKEELAVFRAWQDRQSGYVTNLGKELFGPGISEALITQRVQMWADISLNEIRLRGVALANQEKRYRWDYHPSAQHCKHCPILDGQVHTITEWLEADLYPGSGRTECGPGCECSLTPTDEPTRGNMLRSLPPDAHDHDHEEVPAEVTEPPAPEDEPTSPDKTDALDEGVLISEEP